MNKLNTYKHTPLTLAALAMAITLAGCAEDAGLSSDTAQHLSVTPLVESSATTRATIASDPDLNEDKLTRLNVKVYGENDVCKIDKTFTDNVASKKQEVIGIGDWKNDYGLQENTTYTVKAVANYTGTDGTLTDTDIWKPYDATNSSKTFLMSSDSVYTVTTAATQNIPVQLKRAAAKIVVKLHVAVDGYTPGVPQWQLKNYNAKTTVFGDNTASDLQSGSMTASQGDKGEYTFTTYSYAMTWTDDDKAPSLYIKLPLTDADEKTENNYYKIPVRDPKATGTDAKSLARNTLYTIDATINSKGGSSEVEYIESGKVVYDVLAWSDGGDTRIDANTSYLMVYPQTLIMKNIATDNTSISYKSSDEVEIEINEVYYYDKNGTKKTITQGYIEKDDSGKDVQLYPKISLSTGELGKYEGKINIESAIPINLTAKYIVFTVKTKDGSHEEKVVVTQYPLKYVQNIAGWYSTKDGWIDWQTDQTKHNTQKTSQDSHFNARVYGTFEKKGIFSTSSKTGIWDYEDEKESLFSSSYTATPTSCNTSQANNHMYVIQITKSDGTYKIAKPKFKDDLTTDDNTVSPAFMLASQLGIVSTFRDVKTAAEHCNKYIEVSQDGKKYDDWRLPTKAEINSIVEFQNDKKASDTMDRVLAGQYYWTANGEASDAVPGADKDSNKYVRCIRDLSAEEVQELENKK